jgi:ABC-type sugar transport system permease subunit
MPKPITQNNSSMMASVTFPLLQWVITPNLLPNLATFVGLFAAQPLMQSNSPAEMLRGSTTGMVNHEVT